MFSLFDVWPETVTVTVAVPGLSGNGPLEGGSWKLIEPSLQLVIVSLAKGLDLDDVDLIDGDTDEIDGGGPTVPLMFSVCGAEVCPATVTVTVALPGSSGNGPLVGGSWNVIEPSLQLVMVSLAPS